MEEVYDASSACGEVLQAIFDIRGNVMSWTEERIELLKKLWAEGLSASQIAGRLGHVTRNAVCGKAHRLGLYGRATSSEVKKHRPQRQSRSVRNKLKNVQVRRERRRFKGPSIQDLKGLYGDAESYVPAAEEFVIPLKERKTFATLTETSCRWPIGDPQDSDFHFCNRDKVAGLPYCETHARRAFQPRARTAVETTAVSVVAMAAVMP